MNNRVTCEIIPAMNGQSYKLRVWKGRQLVHANTYDTRNTAAEYARQIKADLEKDVH